MDPTMNQCPKCAAEMNRGFVLDRQNVLGLPADRFPRWVEGEPERGISGNWTLVGRKTNEIRRADRCGNCGYVEFYASLEVQYV
jgi:predicted nucleic-acid-binding Zn-ribbon protein